MNTLVFFEYALNSGYFLNFFSNIGIPEMNSIKSVIVRGLTIASLP